MAVWDIDVTTEDGAVGAARLGSIAAFVCAGLTFLGLVFALVTTAQPGSMVALLGVVLAELAIFFVAGVRLRMGRGVVWGSVAALLLLLEIVLKLISLTGIPGVILNGILLIVLVNGVRAAWAIRKGIVYPWADAEVFR